MSAPTPWEKALVISGLFLSTAAIFPLLRTDGQALAYAERADALASATWIALYAVVAALLLLRFGQTVQALAAQKLLLMLVGLAAVSTLWSQAPALTLQRSTGLALTTAFAVYVATRFARGELLDLLGWTLALVAAVSLVLIVLEPSLGLDHVRGDAWRGAFTTKNELGRMMTFGALVWLARIATRRGRMWVSLAFLAVSLVLVAGSGSRGSLVALATLAILLLVLKVARAHESVALPGLSFLLLAGGCAFAWIAANPGTILSRIGADTTITGRTEIWSTAWDFAQQQPWLGYGYDAFWLGPVGPSGQLWATVGSLPPHAHNGLLDLWLELGLVGVAILSLSFLGNVRSAGAQLRRPDVSGAAFPVCFLGCLFVFNLTESSLLTHNSIFWILYVAVSVQLAGARAAAVVVRRHRTPGFAVPVEARP